MHRINPKKDTKRLLIGRSEWCQLPDLSIPAIKAKIDTGAKTSSLHAFNIRKIKNKQKVLFDVHPIQGNNRLIIQCQAKIIDARNIMSSNGQKEFRYVIASHLIIAGNVWKIELTLSNRDPMKYRMLLGREALNHRVLIDPALTCHLGKVKRDTLKKIYHSL